MNDEDGFEVRVTFKVKASIKNMTLAQWRDEMEIEEYDSDYLDVAKFVAKQWNATGDYYWHIDAAGTEWEAVVLKETAQIAESCAKEGCGRIKSDLIHRLVDEDDMRTTHKFVPPKTERQMWLEQNKEEIERLRREGKA